MRKVKLESGDTVDVYSLKWRDERKLRNDNLHPETIKNQPAESLDVIADEAIRTTIEMVLGKAQADGLWSEGSRGDVQRIYNAIWRETYPTENEEKN